MTKPKLHKALLSIWLAIATTLTIRNEIKAMETGLGTIDSTIGDDHNNNDQQKQTDTNNTFTYQLKKYIKEEGNNKPLNPHKITNFLKKYIKNDINKYLALLIQSTYNQIPKLRYDTERLFLYSGDIHKQLISIPLHNNPEQQIITDDKVKLQISNILNYIDNEGDYANNASTNLATILYYLTSPGWKEKGHNKIQDHLYALIDDYRNEINTTVDENKTNPLSWQISLDTIAEQLKQDYLTQAQLNCINQPGQRTTIPLDQLAQIVSTISEAYKSKQNKPQNSIASTITQKLIEFIYKNPGKQHVTDEELIQILKSHIRDDISKYLALLIQSNYGETPTTQTQDGKSLIESTRIAHLLIKDPLNNQQGVNIITNKEKKEQLSQLLEAIRHVTQKPLQEQTTQELIISSFFTTKEDDAEPVLQDKELIDTLINTYKEAKTTVNKTYSTLISYLRPVVDQLNKEYLAHNENGIRSILDLLAQQIQDFLNANETKQLGNEEIIRTQNQAEQASTQTEVQSDRLNKSTTNIFSNPIQKELKENNNAENIDNNAQDKKVLYKMDEKANEHTEVNISTSNPNGTGKQEGHDEKNDDESIRNNNQAEQEIDQTEAEADIRNKSTQNLFSNPIQKELQEINLFNQAAQAIYTMDKENDKRNKSTKNLLSNPIQQELQEANNEENTNNIDQAGKEANYADLLLLAPYRDKLVHKPILYFLKGAEQQKLEANYQNFNNDGIKTTLKLLAEQYQAGLVQLVYADLLKFDITTYATSSDQEEFNEYLKKIIKTGILQIGEYKTKISHPLVSLQPTKNTLNTTQTDTTQNAQQILKQILTNIANDIERYRGHNYAQYLLDELNKAAEQTKGLEKATKEQLIKRGHAILDIAKAAEENSTTTRKAALLFSKKKRKIRTKIIVIESILNMMEEQLKKETHLSKNEKREAEPQRTTNKISNKQSTKGQGQKTLSKNIS